MSIIDDSGGALIFLVIPSFLLISIPIRFWSKSANIHCSPNLLLLIIAVGVEIFSISIFGPNYLTISDMHPHAILCAYFPIFILSTMYRLDYFIFMRCLPQILIISFVGVVLRVTLFCTISYTLLHLEWPFYLNVLSSLCFAPIQPTHVIMLCKELSKFKHLATILEAESVISCIPVMASFAIVFYYDKEDAFLFIFAYYLFNAVFGLIVGCIVGKMGSLLLGWVYNDPLAVICISLGLAMVIFYLAEVLLFGMGVPTVTCYAIFISSSKYQFSLEVDASLLKFLNILNYGAEVSAFTVSAMEMTRLLWLNFYLRGFFEPILTYITANMVRMVCLTLIGTVLRKMAYEMKMKCMVMLGWCDVKGAINILLALVCLSMGFDSEVTCAFATDILICLLLSLAINSSTMRITFRILGVSDLSPSRKTNMNSCMKYLMDKRITVLSVMKLNRYLNNANWNLVRSETILTHPYKEIHMTEDVLRDEILDDYISTTSTAICPSCYKEIPFDITDIDFSEMKREAQIKIWKAKKVSVIKQFENGTINKSCLQVLTHVFEMMIELNMKSDLVNLKSYFKKRKWMTFIRRILVRLNKQTISGPPRDPFHRFCYYLSMHILYDYILFLFVIGYTVAFMCYIFLENAEILIWVCLVDLIIFTLDFLIKIAAYTKRDIADGFRIYLCQFWNVFDLVILALTLIDVVLSYTILTKDGAEFVILRAIGLLRWLKIFHLLQTFYAYLLRIMEYNMDSRVCFGYDLGTALVNCCDEVLDSISQLIETKAVRDLYIEQLQDEKFFLLRSMEIVQKERPWVAITMKTKQAIRTTLSAMEDVLTQLKNTGFLDIMEHKYIYKELFAKEKMLRNMEFVQASPPKVIFNEVPWMADDSNVIDFLYSHVELVTWQPRDIVCVEGTFSDGIYIVVSGLLTISYKPNEHQLEKLKTLGSLPIVDYMSTLHFEDTFEDNIMSGNSFGELSLLTNRPYNCTIVAGTPCQAYLLRHEVIKQAMALNNDCVRGLEARMWKCCTINLAVAVLQELPVYQYYSQEQIKFKLEKAFVPNIRCYKMFVITDLMEDAILLDGIVADFITGEIFVAPVVLPKTVQKMIFPRSSYFSLEEYVDTKIMIIALGISKDYEIMRLEEDIAELVAVPSSSCLLNKAHESSLVSRNEMRFRKMSEDKSILFTQESTLSVTNSAEVSLKEVEVLSETFIGKVFPDSAEGHKEMNQNRQSLAKSILGIRKLSSK